MEISLLVSGDLSIVIRAIRKCYDSMDKSDDMGERDQELIRRIIASGHHSVIEHMVYTFEIDGISRGCLQEFSRHRISSPSVKSTRYTLGRLKKEAPFTDMEDSRLPQYLVWSDNTFVNQSSVGALELVRVGASSGIPNDQLKYCLPEAFKTSLIWTINARSLRNFYQLRSAPGAHWEIKNLALKILSVIPKDHLILFEDLLNQEEK